MKRKLKVCLCLLCLFIFVSAGLVIIINQYVKASVEKNILSANNAQRLENIDCILILGCGLKDDNTMSQLLKFRLEKGIELYNLSVSKKVLMSYGNNNDGHNIVNAMKEFAIENEVLPDDIFIDNASFSTYESIYRAQKNFKVKKVVIVTQEYHIYRAVYIAKKLGLEAYGVTSNDNNASRASVRDTFEVLKRVKDFFYVLSKPEKTYFGDAVPVNWNENITNDKY